MPQAAEQLEPTPTIATRYEYLAECRKYLNTRWQHQGRSLKGIDCAGLLVVPALTLGILQPTDDVTNYGRTPHDDTLTVLLHKHCRRLDDWRMAQPADILAIKYAGPQPQHLMVVTKSYDVRWGFPPSLPTLLHLFKFKFIFILNNRTHPPQFTQAFRLLWNELNEPMMGFFASKIIAFMFHLKLEPSKPFT